MSKWQNASDVYKKLNFTPVRGSGFYLYNKEGSRILDFSTNFGSITLGYSDSIIEQAIISQLNRCILQHPRMLQNNTANDLVQKLVALAGFYDYENSKLKIQGGALLFSSATEANECAIKLARRRYNVLCERDYNEIICFENSNHGNSIAMLSAPNNKKNTIGFEPLSGGFKTAKINNIKSVEELITEHTCAIMVETIQLDKGIACCDNVFLSQLRELCTKHEIILILDETRCGSGRTGTFFAYEKYRIKPDIVTISNGFAGGLPVSACIFNKEIEQFVKSDNFALVESNKMLCNVALSVINKVIKIDFLKNIQKMSKFLEKYLRLVCERYNNIIDSISCIGLIAEINIRDNINSSRLVEILLSNGLLVEKNTDKNSLLLFPPLNIQEEQIKEAIKILITSIEEIEIIERY